MGGIYGASYRSWMLFVDGENLTLRAQDYLSKQNRSVPEGKFYKKDCFIWMPGQPAVDPFFGGQSLLAPWGVRSYYYTSLTGDDVVLNTVERQLWNLGFTPRVFKKTRREEKAKGVDIALTKDMLVHAFHDHYDAAALIAGDGDYVPLVNEVKRYGKRVICVFFESPSLNESLKLAADEFSDLTPKFDEKWASLARQAGP